MKRVLASIFLAVVIAGQAAFAGQPKPTELAPIRHADAALIIVAADGQEHSYSPAELEKFSTYSLMTTTPWREQPADFAGVMLSDLLAAHGLDQAAEIRVTAENDYSTTMSRELLSSVPVLVATRVDGKAHSRRQRGPIQFIIDADDYSASPLTSESNFVWMAARIEAAR